MNYLTKPQKTKNIPKGIPYIIGNELAERFSFYGMKCILIIFMTQYLINDNGIIEPLSDQEATKWYHLFTSAVYFTPIFGALLSDVFIGKYKTILILSIIYCFGHLTLAIDETRFGLIIGLSLISIGAGGIKPCVSAHVGDQFGKTNSIFLTNVFSWFYLSINLGAFVSTLLTPYLLHNYGPWLAFGIPGLLMFIATYIFWLGRHVFIHIPPQGLSFFKKIISKDSISSIMKLSIIYIFIAIFWSLFDQTGSTWVLQAENLNRNWFGINWYSSQIQSINPIMILIFAPLFSYYLYPKLNKITKLTDLKKISLGLFLAVPSFIIIGLVEKWIELGFTPSIGWQVLAYIILTASEVLVSITCLEFSYTQAPNFMKSLIMGFFLLSVSLGNIFTVWINDVMIFNNISYGQSYYNFYAFLMLATATIFLLVVKYYKPNYYINNEQ